MSNQAEPKTNTTRYNLTTQSLGIADTNVKDLAGFMLNKQDISTAVMKILLSVGIKNNAIGNIIVGCDEDRELRITAEISKKSLSKKKDYNDEWATFTDYSDEDDKVFSKEFYNTLKNKIYYKHLDYKTVTRVVRKDSKKKTEKFIQIKIDPEILIAFVYNLDYSDPYYRISCKPIRWLNDKELNRKYDSHKKVTQYKIEKNVYLKEKLSECIVIVTYAIDKKREYSLYDTIVNKFRINGMTKEDAMSKYSFEEFSRDFNETLSSGDFHPKQVLEFNGDDTDEDDGSDYKKNKKKKNK